MLENIFLLYPSEEREEKMYLYPNITAHLNNLFKLFARQPLLPMLVRIKKEINK